MDFFSCREVFKSQDGWFLRTAHSSRSGRWECSWWPCKVKYILFILNLNKYFSFLIWINTFPCYVCSLHKSTWFWANFDHTITPKCYWNLDFVFFQATRSLGQRGGRETENWKPKTCCKVKVELTQELRGVYDYFSRLAELEAKLESKGGSTTTSAGVKSGKSAAEKVKEQGDLVRQLKADKASKEVNITELLLKIFSLYQVNSRW